MIVHWTKTAVEHLDAIHQYIANDSTAYARHMADRLTRRTQQIADHPYSGRKVPEYDADSVRELIEGPYRIIYHIKQDRIDVIAVLHGAMNRLGSQDS